MDDRKFSFFLFNFQILKILFWYLKYVKSILNILTFIIFEWTGILKHLVISYSNIIFFIFDFVKTDMDDLKELSHFPKMGILISGGRSVFYLNE